MASIIEQRLTSLKQGDLVLITLKDMSCVSGTVSVNAPESREIEIATDAGDEVFRYGMVERVKVSSSGPASSGSKTEPSKHQTNTDRTEADPFDPENSIPSRAPVNGSNPSVVRFDEVFDTLVVKVNDNDLKKFFTNMSRSESSLFSSAYDSFKYGEKLNDAVKQETAARKAKTVFRQDSDRSVDAARFTGGLLCRTHQYDEAVYLAAGLLSEAAMCCFEAHKIRDANAYAAAAIISGETEFERDLYRLLLKTCVLCGDISVFSIMRAQMGTDAFDKKLEPVVNGILQHNNIPIQKERDIPARLRILVTLYTNDDSSRRLYDILASMKTSQEEKGKKSDIPEISSMVGWIESIQFVRQTGVIRVETDTYDFRYTDISDKDFREIIEEQLDAHLDGKVYWVGFVTDGRNAKNITLAENPLGTAERDSSVYDFRKAIEQCRLAVFSPQRGEALGMMARYAVSKFYADRDYDVLEDTEFFLSDFQNDYPVEHDSLAKLGEMYFLIGDCDCAVHYMEKAVSCTDLPLLDKLNYMYRSARYIFESCGTDFDDPSMKALKDWCDRWIKTYPKDDPETDSNSKTQKNRVSIYKWRCQANAILGNISDAVKDLQMAKTLNPKDTVLGQLQEIINDAKRAAIRRGIIEQPEPEPELKNKTVPNENGNDARGTPSNPADAENNDEALNSTYDELFDPENQEDISPYRDEDGWVALHLTKRDVIDYALGIDTDNPNPAMLAYLRAGSALNEDIRPVYQIVAMAANDPAAASDYSIASLQMVFESSDAEYAVLTDYCMASAYLRTSFASGRGYDYSSRALRDSISALQTIPPLKTVCDTLDRFRNLAGRAIDVYADYRNLGAIKLNEDMELLVRKADELYTKYVLTPPRDSIHFARLLSTKKKLFSKDEDFATYLRLILDGNQTELEGRRRQFSEKYLNGSEQIIEKNISTDKIDRLIEDAWARAGDEQEYKKANSTLQGDRRNNIRSNISEILRTVCRWYILSDQGAGLTSHTAAGEATYTGMKPELLDQLAAVSAFCREQMSGTDYPEEIVGLRLVSDTADELAKRLDGTWRFEQERFFYSDFLRSDNVMLDESFLPEQESTFCALEDFNILARIRRHVEGEKVDFPQRLQQIYSQLKAHNNYGSASRIMEYAEFFGISDELTLPPNSSQFVAQTEQQVALQFRDFLEVYALAQNFGQIMRSDLFCVHLEETVRYWYAYTRRTKNYGFFITFVQQAERQIHASAQVYEHMLEEQLENLIKSNKSEFENEKYEGVEDAIRSQIAQQNFIVVEDWMSRIRNGDLYLLVKQPEALTYLNDFWTSYAETARRVGDASKTLSALFNRQNARNKEERGASQLVDAWLRSGNASTPQKIEKLLNLLGWQKLHIESTDVIINTEAYIVHQDKDAVNVLAPPHPIAAFGSKMTESRGTYVVCLYGTYHADTLYEKIRSLDSVAGNKIILLDYAMSGPDRHAIARKMKQRESGIQNVYLVIDRVVICHLADNYNGQLVNRRLMAIGMPFTYYQPYVAESAKSMPPELFVGRKDELHKVENPDGVNLIYGGRQLGKTALFKKARADLDGVDRKRAVYVDINGRDCASAAYRLSTELIELDILPDVEATDNWEVLCDNIRRRLRSRDDISYLLVMLDEAEVFIQDCANNGYAPLRLLEALQNSLDKQFKFVLAGLHNIVRFARTTALGNNVVNLHFPFLKITPFRAPEAQELLTMPLSYLGLSLPSQVTVSQILATTNYFPGLIQMYCEKLIESLRAPDYAGYNERNTPPYVISDRHIRRVLADKDFIYEIHDKFEATLRLDQDQGSYYYPLALLIGWMYFNNPEKIRTGYTAENVLETARDLSIVPIKNLDQDQVETLLQELEDLNMLRSISDKSYVFASKNFRDLLGTYEEIFDKLDKIGDNT